MIKADILEKKKICEGSYCCSNINSPDGRVYLAPDSNPNKILFYSENFGADFEVKRDVEKPYRPRMIALSDGTFIGFGGGNSVFRSIFDKKQENLPFVLAVYTAESMDDVINGKIKTHFTQVHIPHLSMGFGDSGNSFAGCVCNGIVEMSNGDIYVSMYGQFTDDTTLCPYFQEYGEYDFYLYRTWGIVSHDKGKTFEYVSTVADVQTYPIADINAEGYCETDVIEVEDGHLVAILRTGGHEVYSPLYCSHSFDYGKTWDAPYEICGWGVLPRIIKMKNGTLVICSGHIHTMLLFSEDNGKSWSEPFIVEECDGKWDKSPSGYNSVFEGTDGILTVIYDDPKEGIAEGAGDGMKRKLYIAKIGVTKE